jgi:hypothetical protein
VIQHCGQPRAEEQVTSPVTNRLERNLYYGDDLILHFQPLEGGWGFTTAWYKHLPMTRDRLEARLPCFADAMKQVAAQPVQTVDPTIAGQTAIAPVDEETFGIPHLWLIVLLVALLILALLIPTAKRRTRARIVRNKPLRKPSLLDNTRLPRQRLTEVE